MNELEDSDYNSIFENVIKGVMSGFLIAYLLIFGLIPSSKYPDNILDIMDNPWIFAVMLIVNFYILYWDLTIGLLLFISLLALMLDIIIFTEGDLFNDNSVDAVGPASSADSAKTIDNEKPHDVVQNINIAEKKNESLFNTSYKDINDIVISKLKEYKELSENNVKAYNSFI
jgi:hypothetical protein